MFMSCNHTTRQKYYIKVVNKYFGNVQSKNM
jgi:hypothetical protein